MSKDDVEELIYDIYREDIYAEVWKIKEDLVKDFSAEKLETILINDPENFIKQYCIMEGE